jgi:excisionase family DNA binding protein
MTALEVEKDRNKGAAPLEPLSVAPREACRLLSIGITRLYELLADGELQSYVEGNRARRVLYQSIRAYVDRRVAQDVGKRRGSPRKHQQEAVKRRAP